MVQKIWQLWKRFARVLGVVNTFLLLTITYVLIFGPVALVMRLTGQGKLHKKEFFRGPHWEERVPGKTSPETYTHPF